MESCMSSKPISIVKSTDKECSECDEACTKEYIPVCGSDGQKVCQRMRDENGKLHEFQ